MLISSVSFFKCHLFHFRQLLNLQVRTWKGNLEVKLLLPEAMSLPKTNHPKPKKRLKTRKTKTTIMPSYNLLKRIANFNREELSCGICFEQITIQGKLSDCAHPFCFVCIEQWSKTENSCPLCKTRFLSLSKIDVR